VESTEPLKLDLFSGQRYGGRFLACLIADRSGNERDRANSMTIMTLKAIVDQAEASAIQQLASDIEITRLADPSYDRDVLELHRADILCQIDLAIDRGGYEALKQLFSQTNCEIK
jgi:hypothetical protein